MFDLHSHILPAIDDGAKTIAESLDMLAIAAKALRMPPAKAARIILDAARRRTPRVLVGADAKLLDVIPRLALSQMRRIMRVGTPRKRR